MCCLVLLLLVGCEYPALCFDLIRARAGKSGREFNFSDYVSVKASTISAFWQRARRDKAR